MIFKTAVSIATIIYTVLTIVLTFLTWEEIGVESKQIRIILLITVLIVSACLAIAYICLIKNKVIIYENGNSKITICYDDIIKIAFKKNKKNNKKIVVIPVNTCFDTIVDEDISKVKKPLVSLESIHGKWIKAITSLGISLDELDKKIKDSLEKQEIYPISVIPENEKNRGKREEYAKGTTAIINENENTYFFLFALSKFDDYNNAQRLKEEFVDMIHGLISFYNKNGQGYELFVPLMGTNLSRIDLSHEEALDILESSFKLYSDKMHGKISIIIYNKEKNKVAICKNN